MRENIAVLSNATATTELLDPWPRGEIIYPVADGPVLALSAEPLYLASPARGFGKAHRPGNRQWAEKGKREAERRRRQIEKTT